jgi:hypothetical protein
LYVSFFFFALSSILFLARAWNWPFTST